MHADPVSIRPATREDVPGILEIYNDAVLHTTASYDYEPNTLEQRIAWFEDHAHYDYPIFVAEKPAAGIVGWSSLNRFHARPGYRFTTENSVYIAAAHRGQGIGKLLMPPLIAGAKARSMHVILAAIDATNQPSIRLHASFGFEQTAFLKQVGFKFGRWLDVVYMQLLV